MTFKDKVKEMIKELDEGDLTELLYADYDTEKYPWSCVHQEGGEGQGDFIYSVFVFTPPDVLDEPIYVKFYGYYSSYNGQYYEGYKFVTPKQKTITVYE